MKITSTLDYYGKYLYRGVRINTGREPQISTDIPFKPVISLNLSDKLRAKGSKNQSRICIKEVNELLTCLGKNDFDEESCLSEKNLLQTCHDTEVAKARKLQMRKQSNRYGKNVDLQVINKFLKQYPQHSSER